MDFLTKPEPFGGFRWVEENLRWSRQTLKESGTYLEPSLTVGLLPRFLRRPGFPLHRLQSFGNE